MLARSPAYRKLALLKTRFGRLKRHSNFEAALNGARYSIPDAASFFSMYEEIFVHEIYRLPDRESDIRILDLGANIGLSVAYFRKTYPSSRVVAYEADPAIFRCLETNMAGFEEVKIHNAAVWDSDGLLPFQPDGADGGHISPNDGKSVIFVESVDIRRVLEAESFDMIKMDIEGAESTVLPACRGLLGKTRYLFFEYHDKSDAPQTLDALLGLLRDEGFRFVIHSIDEAIHPFIERNMRAGFEMQLNVFAWKSA